jgi:hypothetical protein
MLGARDELHPIPAQVHSGTANIAATGKTSFGFEGERCDMDHGPGLAVILPSPGEAGVD